MTGCLSACFPRSHSCRPAAYVATGLAPAVYRLDIDPEFGRKETAEVRAGATAVVVMR